MLGGNLGSLLYGDVSVMKNFAQVISFDSGSHWIFHSTLFLSRKFPTAYGYSTPFSKYRIYDTLLTKIAL